MKLFFVCLFAWLVIGTIVNTVAWGLRYGEVTLEDLVISSLVAIAWPWCGLVMLFEGKKSIVLWRRK